VRSLILWYCLWMGSEWPSDYSRSETRFLHACEVRDYLVYYFMEDGDDGSILVMWYHEDCLPHHIHFTYLCQTLSIELTIDSSENTCVLYYKLIWLHSERIVCLFS
jgi:hypothetical protein